MPRILLVDDDDSVRRVLRLTLEPAGYEVIEARNGREAIRTFDADPVDVILTDLIMPEMEGIETIRTLRRDGRSVPIVAMSGGGHVDRKNLLAIAAHLGANRVLAKPFTNDELFAALEAALQSAAHAPGARSD